MPPLAATGFNKERQKMKNHDTKPFSLRIPHELKAKLEAAAEKNHRSLNSEILARLENRAGTAVVIDNCAYEQASPDKT